MDFKACVTRSWLPKASAANPVYNCVQVLKMDIYNNRGISVGAFACAYRFCLIRECNLKTEVIMGGCFGNHPFDRAMENQLFQHLDGQAKLDEYFESVCEQIQQSIYDEYENYILNDIQVDEWAITLMGYGVSCKISALVIEVLLKREYGDSNFILKKRV